MLKVRVYVVICTVLALLAGGVVASARSLGHPDQPHHKRPHRLTVLPYLGPQPSPSIFGIDVGVYDTSHANYVKDAPSARSLGARWVHITSGSVSLNRSGRPNWGPLDDAVTRARMLGLGVFVTLGAVPNACSLSPRPTSVVGCPPTTSRDLMHYRAFLLKELRRYRHLVQYWESWIEPNNKAFWRPAANPQQYANLLEAQYQVFQQVNQKYHTHLKLVFGGPISFSTEPKDGIAVLPFVHQVLTDLHGARAFDAIGLKAYRFPSNNNGPADLNWGPTAVDYDYVGGIPYASGASGPYPAEGCDKVYSGWCQMNWPEELQAYEQEFADDGYPNMPLWITQFGWPGNATPAGALYPSFETQAQYLTQAYDDLLQLPFVQAAFWFNVRDYKPGLPNPDPAFFAHYGLLQYGFARKPAGTAFEQIAHANPTR
jgi:hypothetical protein